MQEWRLLDLQVKIDISTVHSSHRPILGYPTQISTHTCIKPRDINTTAHAKFCQTYKWWKTIHTANFLINSKMLYIKCNFNERESRNPWHISCYLWIKQTCLFKLILSKYYWRFSVRVLCKPAAITHRIDYLIYPPKGEMKRVHH